MSENLTPKQQRFVAAVATGMRGKDAVVQAGYQVSSQESACSLATTMLKNTKIQTALKEAIQIEFPNIAKITAESIMKILNNDDARDSDKLKAIQILISVCGWQAPTTHASVNVSVLDKFKLPEE